MIAEGRNDAMAEKDITEKTLEAYNDVFADIINVLLFNLSGFNSPQLAA